MASSRALTYETAKQADSTVNMDTVNDKVHARVGHLREVTGVVYLAAGAFTAGDTVVVRRTVDPERADPTYVTVATVTSFPGEFTLSDSNGMPLSVAHLEAELTVLGGAGEYAVKIAGHARDGVL